MILKKILHIDIQNFINDNLDKSIAFLALQKNLFSDIDYKIILNQIEAKVKSKEKLPTWFATQNIIYPQKISIEQTSSEIAANYKATLVTGKNLFDATGGFGIDDYYFAQQFETVFHCEINPELSEIVQHNFEVLKVTNIKSFCGDSALILNELNQKFDCIYLDPSRRSDSKGKVFLLADCLPNVVDLQDFYYQFSDMLLIKVSPILDIDSVLREVKNVKEVHVVAINNEVKELLFLIEKNYNSSIQIKTINILNTENQIFNFEFNEDVNQEYSQPLQFLYEPNAAIMKAGGFSVLGEKLKLKKLGKHSHLFTSNDLIDFPGRKFKVIDVYKFSKEIMKQHFENQKCNITIRNFPETVENLRKKYKIKDGGNRYCFFTQDENANKIIVACEKV